ncbi:MAG: putative Rab GTPase, partial [Streblomastix strix]
MISARHKVVLLGDSSPTIALDFLTKTLYFENQQVILQIWDTAGQERFRSLVSSYIRDCSAAIIIYDITNRDSFDNIDGWINDVRNERGDEAVILIVGNKYDLDNQRAIPTEEGQQKAKEYD